MTELRERGTGHPKGLLGNVGSGLEFRDSVEMARLARPGRLRSDRRIGKGEDFGLVGELQAHMLVNVPRTGVVDVFGEVTGAFDGAEAKGGGGEALGGSEFGKGVEEGGGEGAEHEEEVEVGEDVMEVPYALDFGRDYRGVLFKG